MQQGPARRLQPCARIRDAIQAANGLQQLVLAVFGQMADYPDANERHYAFMLGGGKDFARLRRGARSKMRFS